MDESGISLGFDDQIFLDVDDLPNFDFHELRSKTLPSVSESPNFKTEIPSTRTQIRQQLQREKILQDEQKRVASEATKIVGNVGEPVRVPVNSLPVVPQHVLKVTTTLQHPTKYHILAKQNNQVLNYLSTSHEDVLGLGAHMPRRTKATHSAPSTRLVPPQTRHSSSSSYNLYSPEIPSPSVSSVATSGGTSDAEEVIEGILSYEEEDTHLTQSLFGGHEKLSLPKLKNHSCPSDLQLKLDPGDRAKKETHNIIERRRRCNINDRIQELGELLPKPKERHYNVARDNKLNKGTILKATVDYIKVLKDDERKLEQCELEKKMLTKQNRELLLKIKELERKAKQNGVALDNCTWNVADPETIFNTIIKTEPGTRHVLQGGHVVCIQEGGVAMEEDKEEGVLHKDAMLCSPLSYKSTSSAGSHYNFDDVDMNTSS